MRGFQLTGEVCNRVRFKVKSCSWDDQVAQW